MLLVCLTLHPTFCCLYRESPNLIASLLRASPFPSQSSMSSFIVPQSCLCDCLLRGKRGTCLFPGLQHTTNLSTEGVSNSLAPYRTHFIRLGPETSPHASEARSLSQACLQTPRNRSLAESLVVAGSCGWHWLIKQRFKSLVSGSDWASGTQTGNISSLGGKEMTNSFLRKPSRQSELLDADKSNYYFQIHIAGSSKRILHTTKQH